MITSLQGHADVQASRQGSLGEVDPVASQSLAIGPMRLPGDLWLGPCPTGLVVLVRCSGAGNGNGDVHAHGFVRETFRRHRLATLSLDLLTNDEAADERRRSDVALLARRVGEALQWIAVQPQLTGYRCALFGAGIGGAALLQVAAQAPGSVDAVVARGARLDLAWPSLPAVHAPTLLIAGSEVPQELELHSAALRELHCAKRLEVIPGATRALGHAGVLETVADLSAGWLMAHLGHRDTV